MEFLQAISRTDVYDILETRDFPVRSSELTLKYRRECPESLLAFKNNSLPFGEWREKCAAKLAELLNISCPPEPCEVYELRRTNAGGVDVAALVMCVDVNLSIPAYLLLPERSRRLDAAVMAIHGHGEVGAVIGIENDYHHMFALELAKAGHAVLCPELRGFGALRDVATQLKGHSLDYWSYEKYRQFTLASDAFLKGHTMIGESVLDLLRWEDWLFAKLGISALHAAGISYGGDLALTYPVFSKRVDRIFASGTLGSFSVIYEKCYNAPAHCIPGVLQWMDRADIAGLNAPRRMAIHYGELDVPSEDNASASYNETVGRSMEDLKDIYRAAGCEENIHLLVTPNAGHEMDIAALKGFLE